LKSARRAIARIGFAGRIRWAQGLAENMSPTTVELHQPCDHAVPSYALSMIIYCKQSLSTFSQAISNAGQLYIVDFGNLSGLGTLRRSALTHWLALFHVAPCNEIVAAILQNNDRKIAGNAHFTMLSAHYAFMWRGGRDAIAAMQQ
jgi:S-adenosylmethionine-diacylgycerolhomoserine-N-methlytransferase